MRRIEKNWLEWSVFAGSLVLVLATIGYLVAESIARPPSPPEIRATIGTVRATDAGFLLPVTVRNTGGQTAENVVIEVLVETSGELVERAELSFAFLPRGATREGWVVLRRDPRSAASVTARAKGFETP
ncbi:MAG TPA: hypothetical protein VJ596_07285 [Gemmatimonadaceae bacterium]|nr:hypothetical protein [Gemmatimonadaceae bacterium]